jgi:hypothetical protein
MELNNARPFSAPLIKAIPDKKFVNGKLYGHGDIAIIFSNMDTNEQNEWNPIINDLISDRFIGLTYDYPDLWMTNQKFLKR